MTGSGGSTYFCHHCRVWHLLEDTCSSAPGLHPPSSEDTLLDYTKRQMGKVVDGSGSRHNENKRRMDLLCPLALEALADVLTYGASKYETRNWERGNDWGVPIASLLRHLTALMAGEDDDPESGLPHTSHILFNAMQLHRNFEIYPEGDDRSEALKERLGRQ